MPDRDDASVRSMNALRRLVSALRSPGVSSAEGMSVAQQFALRMIGSRPGLTMTELAEGTLTTRSAVSEVVSRLVERGLVVRSTDSVDSRRVHLRLSSDGAALWSAVGPAVPERLVSALCGMNPESRVVLAESLELWVTDAGLGQESPNMFGEGSVSPSGSRTRSSRRSIAQPR